MASETRSRLRLRSFVWCGGGPQHRVVFRGWILQIQHRIVGGRKTVDHRRRGFAHGSGGWEDQGRGEIFILGLQEGIEDASAAPGWTAGRGGGGPATN